MSKSMSSGSVLLRTTELTGSFTFVFVPILYSVASSFAFDTLNEM